jgi:signal transduction histidine kinase
MDDGTILEHIRFSPDILSRLGEELIPSPEQGIIELVKNSYDAEASICSIELKSDTSGVYEIIISDNGCGMDLETIRSGWLVLGRSTKISERTKVGRFSRFQVGDKGLGRLSALRQGQKVTLITRPKSEPGVQYSLEIEWEKFDNVKIIEDVDLRIDKAFTKKENGTEIIIKELKSHLSKSQVEKLARDLILLSDPFESRFGFKVDLITKDYEYLEKLVKKGYFEDAEYHLQAELFEGKATVQVTDWKGDVLYSGNHSKVTTKNNYNAPNTKFELWAYILGNRAFSTKKSPINEIRTWLSVVGGVHIYHRGMRIKPYGDPSTDWLEMNLKRSRSPEERPSTNNSIGIVVVDDPEDQLIAKTDRIGFVENETFFELKNFCQDCLDWMAKERLKIAEKRRRQDREKKPRIVIDAGKKLEETISVSIPEEVKPIVVKAVEQYQKAVENEVTNLKEELQLYRSLATAGAMIAKFAHQTGKPISTVLRLSTFFENKGHELLRDDFSGSTFDRSVQILKTAAETIRSYSIVPITMLKREKRRTGVVFIHDTINNSIALLQSFLEKANIAVDLQFYDGDICIRGSEALLESIITNFITNSITALTEGDHIRTDGRLIIFRTEFEKDIAIIKALDNGPGILIDVDEIWLPGRTTTLDGTGFGLTIVKDSVSDLSGQVSAIAQGELGGAEFKVEIPAFLNAQRRLF